MRFNGMAGDTIQLRPDYTQDSFGTCADVRPGHACGVMIDNIVMKSVISCPYIAVGPANLPIGLLGAAYNLQFTQTGGAGVPNFTEIGSLPTLLTLTPLGLLSGTPTQTGTFPFTINVTDANGCKGTANYTLVITRPPTISKSFNPTNILPGGASQLTLVIANPNAVTVGGVGVVDNFPAGVTFVSSVSNTCGGTLSNTTTSLTLVGGSIAGSISCTIVVNVTSNEGIKVNTTNPVTSDFGPGNTATATLTVAPAPLLTKSFGNIQTLLPGGLTGLSFTLTNPSSVVTMTGLAFSDTLPAGLLISNPNGLSGSCDGGTITAVAGTSLITLTGATLAPGASCTFIVNVTAATFEVGLVTNTTSTVTSTEAVPGAAASASIFIGNPFQVRSASNLGVGDSVVNTTNAGTSSTNAFPTQNGNLCVNVYTFSPDEQLISCCACPVTPDGLNSLSARDDLISNTLTPGVPTSIVIKLLASTGPTCNASTVGVGANVLTTGLAAWGTTIHSLPATPGTPPTTYGVTETRFTPATLGVAELTRITTLCGFIQSNGSGFGICRSCRLGGLGAGQ